MGQRRSEVVELEWDEIDQGHSLWAIPGRRTKNARAHEVPLTATVVQLVRGMDRLKLNNGETKLRDSPYVFTTTGKTPVSGLSRAKAVIDAAIVRNREALDADAMPHWTFHDLRRTTTTGMARLGVNPHIADAVLNHKTDSFQGVAAIYNRHAYVEERRHALTTWETHVLAVVADRHDMT